MNNKNKNVEREINKIYEAVFKKIFNEARKNNVIYDKKKLKELILRFDKSRKYKEFCKRFAKQLTKKGLANNRGVWKKYYQAAKENHTISIPKNYTEFETNLYKKIILHNFRLIKSIPEDIMEVYKYKYIDGLMGQVLEGKLGRRTFEKVLKESGSTKAKLIARTESAKLQTAITENNSKDLGSVCYRWRSSHDKRTRPSHLAMNNVIVFWRKDEEKPILDGMQGNAGEFPNCRCDPQPIFDIDDLTSANYNVYDYRTHRVVNMSKERLLTCIQYKQII